MLTIEEIIQKLQNGNSFLMAAKSHQNDLSFLCYNTNQKSYVKQLAIPLSDSKKVSFEEQFINPFPSLVHTEMIKFLNKIYDCTDRKIQPSKEAEGKDSDLRKMLFEYQSDLDWFRQNYTELVLARPNDLLFVKKEKDKLPEVEHIKIDKVKAIDVDIDENFEIDFIAIQEEENEIRCYDEGYEYVLLVNGDEFALVETNPTYLECVPFVFVGNQKFHTKSNVCIVGSLLSNLVDLSFAYIFNENTKQNSFLIAMHPVFMGLNVVAGLSEKQIEMANLRSNQSNPQSNFIGFFANTQAYFPNQYNGNTSLLFAESEAFETTQGGKSKVEIWAESTKFITCEVESLQFLKDTVAEMRAYIRKCVCGDELSSRKDSINKEQVEISLESQKSALRIFSNIASKKLQNLLTIAGKLEFGNETSYFVDFGMMFYLQITSDIVTNYDILKKASANPLILCELQKQIAYNISNSSDFANKVGVTEKLKILGITEAQIMLFDCMYGMPSELANIESFITKIIELWESSPLKQLEQEKLLQQQQINQNGLGKKSSI